jgi:hypothetical protein
MSWKPIMIRGFGKPAYDQYALTTSETMAERHTLRIKPRRIGDLVAIHVIVAAKLMGSIAFRALAETGHNRTEFAVIILKSAMYFTTNIYSLPRMLISQLTPMSLFRQTTHD